MAPRENWLFTVVWLHVSRQGFYKYLSVKDRPWKYQALADTMLESMLRMSATTPMDVYVCSRH